MNRIALNTYSLRNEWELINNIAGLDPIIEFINTLEVSEIELLDRTFHSEQDMLEELLKEFDDSGFKVFSLGPHVNPLTDEPNREKRLSDLKHWTDMAADHGIHMFRVSLGGGRYSDPDLKPTSIDIAVDWTKKVLEPAVEYAETRDVTLAIETHHQFSSNPEFQGKLLDAIPSNNLGFIFDIGNFENEELRWSSLDLLIEKDAVKYVHAKAYDFTQEGFETTLDYPRAVKQLHDAGFNVPLSIEWEGKMAGPIGALKTNELCKYCIAMVHGKEYAMKTDFGDENEYMDKMLEG